MLFKTVGIIALLCLINGCLSVEKEDRIIGGSDVSIQSYPYQGSIKYNNYHICGCSLLNPQIALTAAHCVKNFTKEDLPYLTVGFGSSLSNSGGQRRAIQSFAVHQYYSRSNLNYDVALIKLKTPVQLSKDVQPITLATQTPTNGTKGYVTGWGVLDNDDNDASIILQGANVDVITRQACAQNPFLYERSIITQTMICAAAQDSAPCRGDSGGPLINLQTREQVGIVSWGYICGEKGYPGVYSNVPALRKWITSTAETLARK